jgi:DnaJ-domain-containing protein 1
MGNRTFPRKKTHLEFEVVLAGGPVPAVITDFSLYGLGIFLKGRPGLDLSNVDLSVRDLGLSDAAKIVWKQELFSGIRLGVSYTGPVAGRLRSYGLADLVIGIYRAKKTGVLHIEAAQWSRRIFFESGEMVYASSDIESEQTGSMLLASGMISPQQYRQSLAAAGETGRSQETVLIETRYLTPADLVAAVHQRVEAVIMNLCDVEDAKFSFREGPLPAGEVITMKLNSADLLFRGAKRTERLNTVRSRYFTPGALLHPSEERQSVLHRLSLEQQDRQIFSLLQESTTLGEVLERSPVGEEETIRTIYGLHTAYAVEVEPGKTAQETAGKTGEDADAGLAEDKALEERIDKLYREHRSLGYYGVLGLMPQTASATEIKRAYHDMAKEYHPDRYLHVSSETLKEKLNVIFAYVNEAYREISKGGGNSGLRAAIKSPQNELPEEKSRNLAEAKYREGRECLAAGKNGDAMTLLGQAVYLNASVPDYHFYYGVSLQRNEKMKEAEESVRKALQFSPHNGRYLTELGYIYLRLGFRNRACNAFARALEAEPSRKDAAEGLRLVEKMKT